MTSCEYWTLTLRAPISGLLAWAGVVGREHSEYQASWVQQLLPIVMLPMDKFTWPKNTFSPINGSCQTETRTMAFSKCFTSLNCKIQSWSLRRKESKPHTAKEKMSWKLGLVVFLRQVPRLTSDLIAGVFGNTDTWQYGSGQPLQIPHPPNPSASSILWVA